MTVLPLWVGGFFVPTKAVIRGGKMFFDRTVKEIKHANLDR